MKRPTIPGLTIPNLTIFGAATVLAAALAGPAMAQQVIYNPGYCAQFYPNANCQNKGPGNPYTGDYQRGLEYGQYRNGDAFWDSGRQGYNQGYDYGYYDSGYNGGWNQSYAERNGFICTPGAWFKGEDGRRHRCQ
jgi:hypothetical protein